MCRDTTSEDEMKERQRHQRIQPEMYYVLKRLGRKKPSKKLKVIAELAQDAIKNIKKLEDEANRLQ